ncbi:uncharacterized protein PAC_03685 [Phialocephala subalpina]|uniref:Myocyte-specific enhancer factor 2d n=1 Tax=Phialocephala subalpina TaxID=576137 RepID=A0A1L7WM10_9HELO|nr:uncharacterized protein PAC_03685 [Phialocephala subalpina]
MDRPIREIPGFYYDKDKKKYFKIQGSTEPARSAYSAESVKRRQVRDLHEEQEAKKAERMADGVKRLTIQERDLSGFLMKREFGYRPTLDTPRSILADSFLQRKGYYKPHPFRSTASHNAGLFFNVRPRPASEKLSVEIHCAHLNNVSSSFVEIDEWGSKESGPSVDHTFNGAGQTTSISCNGRFHASTWYSGSTNSGIGVWRGPSSGYAAMVSGPGTDRGRDVDVLSSTAAPETSPFLFAFGTSSGILTYDKDGRMGWVKDTYYPALHYPKDVFALEFLSLGESNQNPSILLCGGRPGEINRIDLRAPVFANETLIFHPSSITHIKQVDKHRIIVPGLESSMCQYDLRFLKEFQDTRLKILRTTTHPYLQYPEYKNKATILAGFDIDTESGLVAAAQEGDDYSPAIQIFSLHSGHVLASRRLGRGSHYLPPFTPNCLRFVRDVPGTMKSLYVATQRGAITRHAFRDGEIEFKGHNGKRDEMLDYNTGEPRDPGDDYSEALRDVETRVLPRSYGSRG